jgi:Bacterial Ig-like domain (group 2)
MRFNGCLRRVLVACVGSLAMAGCCSSRTFDQVLVNLDNTPTYANDHQVLVWVGDRVVVTSSAWQSPNDFCGGDSVFYTSKTNPSAFTYKSSDTTVATIGATGTLTALAIGKTVITATTGGITGVMHVVTVAPIASVRITVTPSTPHSGDTITFHAQAFDAAGAAVDSSSVRLSVGGATYLIPFTNVTVRTIGSNGQTITATATTVRDGAPPSAQVTANVTVTVGPPPL